MRSEATTVEEYLEDLPADRREAISAVREVILRNLPDGYEEVMNWGMIAYQVPLENCPDTYNGQPLMLAGLASQKNHMAVYLTMPYIDDGGRAAFEKAYRATGKRYDVGKSCVWFKRIDDLPLPLIGKAIGAVPADEFVERVKAARSVRKARSS
jgi:hypothetical protein